MSRFELLCVTMNQNGFDKIEEMRINSDVVFANQASFTAYQEHEFNGHVARMVSTQTHGVGVNRNIALNYARAEICLLADDDMEYGSDYEQLILSEFDSHPEADIIIFNIGTSTPEYGRMPTQIKKYKRFWGFGRNPYGAPRIAFRLDKVRKTNLCFTTYFGGGALFPHGEDSIWLRSLMKSHLKVYLSPTKIGNVSYSESTWFENDSAKQCFARGALNAAVPSKTKIINITYFILFTHPKDFSVFQTYKWVKRGRKAYLNLESFKDVCKEYSNGKA